MVEPEARAILEGGCGLLVGLVRAGNRPYATRGWGFDLIEGDDGSLGGRLLVQPTDLARLGLVPGDRPDAQVAVTAAEVHTLRSVQLKGILTSVEEADAVDVERMHRYCEEFFYAVRTADGFPEEVMERWRPTEVVRCHMLVREQYSQTPGPGAGAKLEDRS